MTQPPGVDSLNAPHMHYLNWFTSTEIAYARIGGYYEMRLQNDGASDPTVAKGLKALLYQVPGNSSAMAIIRQT